MKSSLSIGERNGNPLKHSCQKKPMDREAWKWNVKVKSFSCVRLFATPWTVAKRLLHPWNFPGKSTGVGCHFLCQGIFLIQGSNQGLPHCKQMLLPSEAPGKPAGLQSVGLQRGGHNWVQYCTKHYTICSLIRIKFIFLKIITYESFPNLLIFIYEAYRIGGAHNYIKGIP